jgi:adenosylhomocysteinase
MRAVESIGDIAGLILKPNRRQPEVEREMRDRYNVIDISRELLQDRRSCCKFLTDLCGGEGRYILLDIGGYFAAAVDEIASGSLTANIIGIIEDTENGHQPYEQALLRCPRLRIPVCSVARSTLKRTEDEYVGLSIVAATDLILRAEAAQCVNHLSSGVLGLGKVGRSITQGLVDRRVPQVAAFDILPLRRVLARASNLPVLRTNDQIIEGSSLVFSATGNRALAAEQFSRMKDNVFVSSCTSADDEIVMRDLEDSCDEKQFSDHITTFTSRRTGKKMHLLNRGNAVNFCYQQNIVTPYLFMVQAAILELAMQIADNRIYSDPDTCAAAVWTLSGEREEHIAYLWEQFF